MHKKISKFLVKNKHLVWKNNYIIYYILQLTLNILFNYPDDAFSVLKTKNPI